MQQFSTLQYIKMSQLAAEFFRELSRKLKVPGASFTTVNVFLLLNIKLLIQLSFCIRNMLQNLNQVY